MGFTFDYVITVSSVTGHRNYLVKSETLYVMSTNLIDR